MMNQRQSYKEFLQSQGVNDLSYMDEDAKYIIYYMDDGDLKNGELIMFYRNETDEEIQKQASKTALKYYEDSKTVVRVRQWAEVKAFNILIVERWLGYLNQTKKYKNPLSEPYILNITLPRTDQFHRTINSVKIN